MLRPDAAQAIASGTLGSMSAPAGPRGTGFAGSWRALANLLTASRLAAAPALAWAILNQSHGLALGLFVFAVASDFLDGPAARRAARASSAGGLFDHATDATFVSVGLAAVAYAGEVPWLLPLAIVVAFVQYALDSQAIAGRPLRASFLGRWNGIAYFVLLGVPVVRDGLGLGWPPVGLVLALGWVLLATTGLSIADRLRALLSSPRP